MSLPDVSRFERLSPDAWRALRERLEAIGLDAPSLAEAASICKDLLDPLSLPLRRYHLRRRHDPRSDAIRLFTLRDTLSKARAETVFSVPLLDRLLHAGLLRRADGDTILCPFRLGLTPDFVLGDDLTLAGEAVMGAASTTAVLSEVLRSTTEVERVLDLGCGAGALALGLAPRARSVVATDVNPRALVFARVNAWLNGIDNIEHRQGNWYAPVASERFDLIACAPPFVPRPAGSDGATYLYGGRRGDEMPLEVLGGVARHLNDAGRAVMLVLWPIVDDEPIETRVRRAVADSSASVLVLASPSVDLDEWCASHAAVEEPTLGEPFERRAVELRRHLDELGIRGLRLSFTVVVRGSAATGWTRGMDILPLSRARPRARHIDALIASNDLVHAGDDALLGARLRLPAGAELVQRGERWAVRFRDLFAPIELSRGSAMLATAAERAESAGAAIASLGSQAGPVAPARERMLEGLRQALALGVLEPVL